MTWYAQNTVTVTNGSATVTGSGTGFITNVSIGEGFIGPDGRTYEITNVVSDTSFTIKPNYLGSTASGQSYLILPARGRIADLIAETSSLLASFATVRDGIGAGLFPDGVESIPGFRFLNDQDTGIFRAGNNLIGFSTGGQTRAVIDGQGRLGLNIISPTARVDVISPDSGLMRLYNTGGTAVEVTLIDTAWYSKLKMNAGNLTIQAGDTDVLTAASTGKLGVGIANPVERLTVLGEVQSAGFYRNSNVASVGAAANSIALGCLNGTIPTPAAAVGAVLSADAASGQLQLFTRSGGALGERVHIDAVGVVRPGADNAQSLGTGTQRWSVVYAGTGTINTSDEREKVWRGAMTPAELAAAKRIIAELGIYQWNDAIAAKGADNARLHFGVRAQLAFAIMVDEGLDWARYAWCCFDEWDEQTEPELDEDGEPTGETIVTVEAGDRYGIRPDQLAFWLIAAQANIQAELEARLAALEIA